MSGYLLSPRAQADIEEIWDYSVDIWGTDRAERCVRDLWERIKYLAARTHLSLNKDCPDPRPIQPPSAGKIAAFPEVGGLHCRYERRAA
jgi:plasmid stabilization system protein ParE